MSGFYQKILDKKAAGEVYVIAEVGSNYKSHADLLSSINQAKNCGADAVKFQYLTPGELYGPTYKVNSEFPLSNISEKVKAGGIDLICTAFSPEGVTEVNKLVEAHKVASSEMAHIRILEAIKATGKPVILSTGGYFLADIKKALLVLGDGYPVILMHCNLKYPAKLSDVKKFLDIQRNWSGPLGYSDHTTSIDAVPLLYKQMGVCVYEKHFNPLEYADTPDAPHSLNGPEFKVFVSYLKGSPIDYSEETEGRLMHVRRIIAIKDLKPGDVLKEGVNMGIFRSQKPDAGGLSPFAIDKLEGKTVNKNVVLGDGISSMDIV